MKIKLLLIAEVQYVSQTNLEVFLTKLNNTLIEVPIDFYIKRMLVVDFSFTARKSILQFTRDLKEIN